VKTNSTALHCQILRDLNPFVQIDGNAGEFLFEIECNGGKIHCKKFRSYVLA
jgi:hypothetical protein